jgi:hypothetical protein
MQTGTFVAVGQTVALQGADLAALSVGDFVMVYGTLEGSGRIAATGYELSTAIYVPGSTQVFVTGIPSAVDYSIGVATIGDLEINYTMSLGSSDFGGIGAAITVYGTQPALGGAMLGVEVADRTDLFLRD